MHTEGMTSITLIMAVQHGCATWLCNMAVQHGCATWLCNMAVQHGCATTYQQYLGIHVRDGFKQMETSHVPTHQERKNTTRAEPFLALP